MQRGSVAACQALARTCGGPTPAGTHVARLVPASSRRTAYSSTQQDRRYDTGRTDGAAANYIKHKYKLHRSEIRGKRLWEIKASSREVMDQGRALIGEMRAMKGSGWDIGPMAYTSAISVFASYGLSKWSHRLLQEMQDTGLPIGPEAFNSLFWAYAENGEIRGIQAAWTHMKELEVQPDNVTFNVIMMGLQKAGHKAVIFKMFELMKAEGMKADTQCYNTLLTACDTAEEGWGVINKMKNEGTNPDQFSFYFLLKLSSKAGDVRATEDTLRQLAAHRVTATSAHWTILLVAYRIAGDYDGCLRVWERMKDAAVKPTGGTLTELLRAQEQVLINKERANGQIKKAELMEKQLAGHSGACLQTGDEKSPEDELLAEL